MAEAFVGHEARLHPHLTLPDARTVMENLPLWIERYNTLHPHKALGYRSPCEFIAEQTQP
ncbi:MULTISPECIES: integrase core domain-containing protein [Mesorhizobium]|jgi:putative transposase|uniref:integrase core domain-containing protein n=2 Tax=Mesorhizobium TaxID=68287 RepID=UPI00138F5F61